MALETRILRTPARSTSRSPRLRPGPRSYDVGSSAERLLTDAGFLVQALRGRLFGRWRLGLGERRRDGDAARRDRGPDALAHLLPLPVQFPVRHVDRPLHHRTT